MKEFNEDAHSTVGAFLKPMHSLTYFILLLAAIGVINNLLILLYAETPYHRHVSFNRSKHPAKQENDGN